jgi:putative SOS response-associated peptidase YedK
LVHGPERRTVDGFFEWKAIKGQKFKQPYAIPMKDGKPFGLVAQIHTRMPRVNKPENDDPSIVEPITLETSAA